MKTQEELDLEAAQSLVENARRKVLAAEQAKLDVAAKAVADYKARQEQEAYEKKMWAEQIEKKFNDKKKAEADSQLAAQQAETARLRHLENEFNRLEDEKQKRIAAEKEIARQTELARELEKEAERATAEAMRQAIRQREQQAKQETEFSDDGTLPVEQQDGLDRSEGGLEAPGQLNSHLRRLFGRSAEVATETPAFVPNYEQTPQPLSNDDIKLTLDKMYGKAVVDEAVAYLKRQQGVTNLQVYLSQNYKRIA